MQTSGDRFHTKRFARDLQVTQNEECSLGLHMIKSLGALALAMHAFSHSHRGTHVTLPWRSAKGSA